MGARVRAALRLICAISILSGAAMAQLARYDGFVAPAGYNFGPANIAVCQAGGSGGPPCTPQALVYADATGKYQIPQPFQADMNGHYYFYAPAGNYVTDTYGSGYTTTLTNITIGAAVVGVQTFQGPAPLFFKTSSTSGPYINWTNTNFTNHTWQVGLDSAGGLSALFFNETADNLTSPQTYFTIYGNNGANGPHAQFAVPVIHQASFSISDFWESPNPFLILQDTSASAGVQTWAMQSNAGHFYLSKLNDVGNSTQANFMDALGANGGVTEVDFPGPGVAHLVANDAAKITSDYTNATSTPSAFASWTTVGLKTYSFHCALFWQESSTSGALKVALHTQNAGANLEAMVQIYSNNAGTSTAGEIVASLGTFTGALASATGTSFLATVDGTLEASSGGGLDVQAATNGTGTVTIKRGSYCELY